MSKAPQQDLRLLNAFDCDPDFRRNPKTEFYCWRCQKDLKPTQRIRYAFFLKDWQLILHPGDVAFYVMEPNDCGWYPLGFACAKVVGLEWTVSEKPLIESEAGRERIEGKIR